MESAILPAPLVPSLLVHRPDDTEYLSYYSRYIDLVPEGDILATMARQNEASLALLRGLSEPQGGFRYAPGKWSIKELLAHVSDAERSRLGELLDWGMVDVFRERYPDPKLFSWWDYRAGDFHEGRGLRIDLILATKSLADRLTWVVIDRNARKGKQPSDHAPVVADFGL